MTLPDFDDEPEDREDEEPDRPMEDPPDRDALEARPEDELEERGAPIDRPDEAGLDGLADPIVRPEAPLDRDGATEEVRARAEDVVRDELGREYDGALERVDEDGRATAAGDRGAGDEVELSRDGVRETDGLEE